MMTSLAKKIPRLIHTSFQMMIGGTQKHNIVTLKQVGSVPDLPRLIFPKYHAKILIPSANNHSMFCKFDSQSLRNISRK